MHILRIDFRSYFIFLTLQQALLESYKDGIYKKSLHINRSLKKQNINFYRDKKIQVKTFYRVDFNASKYIFLWVHRHCVCDLCVNHSIYREHTLIDMVWYLYIIHQAWVHR